MTIDEVNQIRIDALQDKPTAPEDVLALCEVLLAISDRWEDADPAAEAESIPYWIEELQAEAAQ